jgi:Bacterial inner membrane protein
LPIDCLGWAATVVFVMSYFCKRVEVLRRVQMVGAAMWVIYGLLMQAAPVVTANLLVLLAAAWTAARESADTRTSAVNIVPSARS